MNDLDRILRATLTDRAGDAPGSSQLLHRVHNRSRQLRRRRLATGVAAAMTFLALGVPVTMAAVRDTRLPTPPASSPTVVAPSAATTGSSAPAASSSPSPTGPDDTTVNSWLRLTAPDHGMPTMPWRFPSAVAAAFEQPVVTLQHRALVAYYATRDPVEGADITVAVTNQRPTFGPSAGPVTEVGQRVRSRAGTLRTIDVKPAATLILYWQESATQWIQLRTDDTFTPREVAAFADALTGESMPLDLPLRCAVVPSGMAPETVTPFGMTFKPSGSSDPGVSLSLVAPRSPNGRAVTVGSRSGVLVRDATAVTLAVAIPERTMTLLVEIPARYQISDADAIRFGAGIEVTDRAETAAAAAGDIGAYSE